MKTIPNILTPIAPDERERSEDVLGDILGGGQTHRVLAVERIRRDGGTQPRAGLDARYVASLEADIQAGASLPAADVMFDGEAYWLFDGYHRVAAWVATGLVQVPVRVHQGSLADAQWASYAANKAHGLRRTNEDKRRAVLAALRHEQGATRANREIARHLGVDEKTVREYREQLEATAEIPQSDERVGADGRRINTAKIGEVKDAILRGNAAVWEIEAVLRRFDPMPSVESLREAAKHRSNSPLWARVQVSLNGMRYRWADVSQALNNIASRIEQRVNDQEVKQTIAPTVAYVVAADEAESQALAAPIDIPDIPQLATRAEVADAFRQWVVSVDDAALRSVRADALLRWRLRHALKASCGGKGISDAFLIEEIDSELERRVPELPEHLRHAEICEADRADLANPAEWVATYNAAVRAETREDRLSQYAALFRECMAAAPPWGELTGRHTVTGEAVRGLRKMLDVTERELALLRGEVVAEMSGE